VRNWLIAFVIVLSAIVVTGTQRDSPASPEPQRSRDTLLSEILGANGVYCFLTPDSPHRDAGGQNMVSTARFRCDKPGAQVGMVVSLQRQGANGEWATIATQQFNATGLDTTSDRDGNQRARSVTAACADGTYRTLVEGSSASQNKNGENVQKSHSHHTRGTKNPCSHAR